LHVEHLVRQPLHPLLVHFPLAMWGMSFVFDVLSLRFGPTMVEAARFNLGAGLVIGILAAATGVRDFLHLPKAGVVRRIGRWHAALNAVSMLLFFVSFCLRFRARGAAVTPPWPFVLSALGVVVIGFSGYLGGVMVFNHGAGMRLTTSHRSRPDLH
jgi:uncharacterized membrane protein